MFVQNCNVNYNEKIYPQQKEDDGIFFLFVDDYYYSVRCEICDAEVGIVDKDEIYVFFDVIASYG